MTKLSCVGSRPVTQLQPPGAPCTSSISHFFFFVHICFKDAPIFILKKEKTKQSGFVRGLSTLNNMGLRCLYH